MELGGGPMSGRKWLLVLPVFALSIAGCGAQSPAAGKDENRPAPGEGTSQAAPPSKPVAPGAPAGGSAKPGETVKNFVTGVLHGNYTELCTANAPVLPAGQDPAAFCAQPALQKSMGSLHNAWAKPGVKLPPEGKVEVDVPAGKNGDTVEVPDSAVKLDGRSLRDLELIGSSGNTSSFALTLEAKKKDGRWYVSSWEIEA